MDLRQSFGAWLKQRRRSLALTQEELAHRAGYSVVTIRKVESGDLNPSASLAQALASPLAIRPEEQEAFLRFACSREGLELPPLPAVSPTGLSNPPRPRTNLNRPLTSFVGREAEMNMLSARLRQLDTRLLTLTGSGGTGKTRLAVELGAAALPLFKDGVWWVELSPLADPTLVVAAVAGVLEVHENSQASLIETVLAFLRDKQLLLILDNCEHLLGACAQFAHRALRAGSDLRILASSREPLGIDGELCWRVPSLRAPDPRVALPVQELTQYAAVHLFIERATFARPAFTVNNGNAPAVAEICYRLDGIPLAIELAAARLRTLSAEQVAGRLDDRFQLLTGGSRTALPRHQTLRATIDWSYDLLSELERVFLRRLAVFVGGFTLEAAEQVCVGQEIQAGQVLDLLSHLVDKSMVILEVQGGSSRYRMLETVRQYGHERLAQSGETEEYRCRHAQYYAHLAKEAYPQLWGRKQGYWLARLELEHDNLRATFEWTARQPDREEMLLRFAESLWRFAELHGHVSEGRAWLARALGSEIDSTAGLTRERIWRRADALRGAGSLARLQGDYEQATSLHERSLALFRVVSDDLSIARELDALGQVARHRGEYAPAIELHTESLAMRYQIDDKEGIANSLINLGIIALYRGEYAHAQDLLEEGLKWNRELGDRAGEALSLDNLGLVAYAQCQYDRAQSIFEESLGIYRELSDTLGLSFAFQHLGNIAKDRGDFKRANALYDECLELKRKLGDKRGIARVLAAHAEGAFFQGEYRRAAERAAESLKLSQSLGVKRGVLLAIGILAFVAHYRGNQARARALAEEILVLAKELGARRGVAYSQEILALVEYMQGEYGKALARLQDALETFRQVQDLRSCGFVLVNLARVAYRQGDLELAQRFLDESLTLSSRIGNQWGIAFSLEITALVERSRGNLDRSQELLRESLQLSAQQENKQGIVNCLGALAGLASMRGQSAHSARLFAATEKIRETMDVVMGVGDREEYDHFLNSLKHELDQPSYQAAWREGWAMTIDQAIARANGWNPPKTDRSKRLGQKENR